MNSNIKILKSLNGYKANSLFALRLKGLLAETRTSQKKLADYVGLSQQAVGQWVHGKSAPNLDDAIQIAEFFNVSLDYLLCLSESKVRENLHLANTLGLSDDAIEMLQYLVDLKEMKTLELISKFIANPKYSCLFCTMLKAFYEFNIDIGE